MKTVLYLTGSKKGFKKLKRLHETGELANLIGYNILDIQAYKGPIESVNHRRDAVKPSPSWISTLYQKLKGVLLMPTRPVGWATAIVVFMVIGFVVHTHFLEGWQSFNGSPAAHGNRINTTYKMVLADKNIEVNAGLRVLAFHWEVPPDDARGSARQLSSAAKVFGAGLLTGREFLLGHSDVALSPRFLPSAPENNWLKTQWADYFELGRWTLVLWAVSQYHDEMPNTFWDEQKPILAKLQAAFAARQATDNDAKQAVSNLKLIKTYLEKLPAADESEIYDEFGFYLKNMMDSPLAPRSL
ncbi:MAG: hypothetical protein DRR19_08475 [Candidatus Parabeggiatoa sp. nov. 1]|nr:MAG: hypothetical protein DRR19_08475 [Gammaproteobacteria bacterium]